MNSSKRLIFCSRNDSGSYHFDLNSATITKGMILLLGSALSGGSLSAANLHQQR